MSINTKIIRDSKSHVYNLFHKKNPGSALYHNYHHTVEVAAHAEEIAKGMKLNKTDTEIVLISAWFHDTGYLFSRIEHEERSANIAAIFLRGQKYAEEKIEKVMGCIRATKVPQRPKTVLEQVMCDADLLHLGKKDSIEKGEMLRREIEITMGHMMLEKDWIKQSITFFNSHSYHTLYANKKYNKPRQQNLAKLQQRLKTLE